MPVRDISVYGNLCVLSILIGLLLQPSLFQTASRAAAAVATGTVSADGPRHRVLLVVVDALRADTAADASVMPFLARMARAGARGTLRIDAPVPTTHAAIVGMIEGRVVAPVESFADFGAAPAERGGLFARTAASGHRSVVAGTRLWSDLYGRWIEQPLSIDGFAGMTADTQIRMAVADALWSRPDESGLWVAHFGALDRAAHRYGGTSDVYRAIAGRLDREIARLVKSVGADTRIVIVSDHGVTASGGHAGAEPVVRHIPLVIRSPGWSGALPMQSQTDLPNIVADLLGLPPMPVGVEAVEARSIAGASLHGVALVLVFALAIALTASLRVHPATANERFALAFGVWSTLVAACLLPRETVALFAMGLPAVLWWRRRHATALPGPAYAVSRGMTLVLSRSLVIAFTAGGLIALARLAEAGEFHVDVAIAAMLIATIVTVLAASGQHLRWAGSGDDPRGHDVVSRWIVRLVGVMLCVAAVGTGFGGVALGVSLGLLSLVGALLRIATRPIVAGLAVAIGIPSVMLIAGDSISLSSLDVSLAHRLADSAVGLPGGALMATVRCALPTGALIIGWTLVRIPVRPAVAIAATSGRPNVEFLQGLTMAHLGAIATFAACLASVTVFGEPTHRLTAFALGGLLRELIDVCWIFLALALVTRFDAPRPVLLIRGQTS